MACNLFFGPKGPVVGSKSYRRRIAAACPRKGCVLWTAGDSEGVLSTGGRYFVDADGELRPPVHTGGAVCGRKVPRREVCPQAGGILWTQTGNCGRLSTERVPFVDERCHGGSFVHKRAVFCGRRRGFAPACPHRRCHLWTDGAAEGVLSTGGRYFVDAKNIPGQCIFCNDRGLLIYSGE